MYQVLEKTTYRTWNELSESERNKIRYESSLRDVIDSIIRDDIKLYFQSALVDAALPDDLEMLWSLNACQGDGCSINGIIPVTEKLFVNVVGDALTTRDMVALRYFIADGGELSFNVYSNSNHYVHPYTMEIKVESAYIGDTSRLSGIGGTSQRMEQAIFNFEKMLLSYLRNLSEDVEVEGYRIIEMYESDEYISDFCENNGVLFDRLGRPFWDMMERFKKEPERFIFVSEAIAC